jgi:hypothetical protein
MKDWFASLQGAIALSVVTLITIVWRSFLDAMFVLPFDFQGEVFLQVAAIIFTVLIAGWAWALFSAWRGSRAGLVAAFAINLLVLVAIPISWLLFYCPADCRAEAGVFNLANSLNLVFGVLAAVSLGLQFWPRRQPLASTGG